MVIGNDISNLEVVRWQLKSQFDRGVVTQFDIQVKYQRILDVGRFTVMSR